MPEGKAEPVTMVPVKGVWVICIHCSHGWDCKSGHKQVTCPSCGGKTPRIKEETTEEESTEETS